MHSGTHAASRCWCILLAAVSVAQGQEAKVMEAEGRVVVTKLAARPEPAVVGTGLVARDKLGTGEESRAVLKMSERWFARVDEETDIEITSGAVGARSKNELKLALGGAFIYSREEEGELKIQTPSATGGLRGTELMVRVLPGGKTFMQVLEGEVDLANDFGRVQLRAGEAGEAEVGQAPRKTAVIETRNLLQWALYYPAVLLPEDLGLTADEAAKLALSLEAYRQGDLLGALDKFPSTEAAKSGRVRLFHAAVLLATGRVEAARAAMGDISTDAPGRRALERMLAAVLGAGQPDLPKPATASEAMAESYYQQSQRNLEAARIAARRATELAPRSGFTWARLAELEFSFGRTREALRALNRGLEFAPRNAEAHALRGYLLSAENRIPAAILEFQEAVRLDGGLGNAWLGLGLTQIKQGHLADGQSDLQTAATVEPTRSFFYSYDGKALNLEGNDRLARKDFDLAEQIDPKDPTPWLYAAIQTQQENRYNDAIGDMQQSIDLNGNRRVYRSQFLLDQDSAVRSSNLATIYQNDTMTDLSVREATRAVDSDYTNPSAHLFLADSYYALIDPERVSLKYQTAWFNELLLANLLGPVGGGPLSQFVSQQEYSKLLAPDGIGGSTVTEWRSGGYVDSQDSLFLNHGRLSAGVDFVYHNNNGDRPNNDDLRKEWWGQLKYQVTPDDVVYTLIHWRDQTGGDLFDTYSNQSQNPDLRFEDKQAPGLALIGWHHHWAPGSDTLFLGGRLQVDETVSNPTGFVYALQRDPQYFPAFPPGSVAYGINRTINPSPQFLAAIAPFLGQAPVTAVYGDRFDESLEYKATIYTAELEHIWQVGRNTLLVGGRLQGGPFEASTLLLSLDSATIPPVYFTYPPAQQHVRVEMQRETAYVYDFFNVTPWLTLIGGGSWDKLKYPDDFRSAPVDAKQDKQQRTNAKAGFILTPAQWVSIRGAYTEALGGVLTDEDVRLEPVQFAGFNQSFRTVISESIASSVAAPVYRDAGLSIEGSLPSRTWWGASYNDLHEHVDRTDGTFDVLQLPVFPSRYGILPATTPERLEYREDVAAAGVNQLIGSEFAVGAAFHHTRALLRDVFTQIPVALNQGLGDQRGAASLDQLALSANWNSPTGWFARTEADWYRQTIEGVILGQPASATPGDDFWQGNAEVGYRFHHNQREISVGVLNLTDRSYNLSPLDNILEPPLSRTFYVRCRAAF